MIRRWLALTYYLYALRLAALSHFYFNRLLFAGGLFAQMLHHHFGDAVQTYAGIGCAAG